MGLRSSWRRGCGGPRAPIDVGVNLLGVQVVHELEVVSRGPVGDVALAVDSVKPTGTPQLGQCYPSQVNHFGHVFMRGVTTD